MRFLCLFIFLAFCASGCAQNAPTQTDCPKVYIILPDNFIIDLVAGADVIVNPAIQEFALFCSSAQAREVLQKSGLDNWRVYSLKGDFTELAEPVPGHDQIYRLAVPAQVEDWIGD